MMDILDSHTHIDHLNRNSSYNYFTTMDKLIQVLSENNVKKAICSQMPYSTEYVNIPKGHRWDFWKIPFLLSNILLLEDKDKYDKQNNIIPFFNIHPDKFLTEQIKHIKNLLNHGYLCQGIKYHCQATSTHITSIENIELISLCSEYRLPILLHTWVSKNWNAMNIFYFIKNNPKVNFSVAHLWRLHKLFWDTIVKEGMPNNLFIDLSPFFLVYKTQKIKQCKPWINVTNIPHEDLLKSICLKYPNNILWGTDFPFIKDPEIHPEGSYGENVDLLNVLPTKLQRKISYDNIIKFLWLDHL